MGRRQYYVYLLTNRSGTLYTGVTNDIQRRMYEHKNKLVEGFTKKYNIDMLVYYEVTSDVGEALTREKQIKAWRRSKRVALIESTNPQWRDLSDGWFPSPDSSPPSADRNDSGRRGRNDKAPPSVDARSVTHDPTV